MNGTPLTILLVEDNPAHAEIVLRSFKEHKVANRVVWIEDGESALDYLFREGQYANPFDSPTPSVILLDLRLPRVDGLQVLRRIKEHPEVRNIPVVVLATSEAERDMARAYEFRANSYVVKPLEFDDFAKLMSDLGLYWLSWNRRIEAGEWGNTLGDQRNSVSVLFRGAGPEFADDGQ